MFRIAAAILIALTAPLAAQVKPSQPVAPLNNPKFNGTVKTDTLQILGSGSTGDGSGFSVAPSASAPAGTLARLFNDAPGYSKAGTWGAAQTFAVGSASAPLPISSTFGYGGNLVLSLYTAPSAGTADAIAPALTSRSTFNSGSRGIASGLLVETLVDGTWSPGTSPEAGQVGIFVSSLSRKGGAVFAGGFHGVAETTPGANVQTMELDTIARVSVARKFALVMVDASTSTFDATDTEVSATSGEAIPMSAAARISASAGSAGYKFGILSHTAVGGSRPITDSLWRASGFSLPRGLDWHDVAFTDDAILLPRNSGARVNSGNANFRWRGRYDGGQGLDRGSMTVNYEPSTDFRDNGAIGTAMVDLRGGGNIGTIALATGANGASPSDKLIVTNNASDPINIMVGGSLRQVTVGDAGSCGGGFRCLRVPN